MNTDKRFYGLCGWERLEPEIDDVISRVIDDAGGPDEVGWPLRVYVFKPMEIPRQHHIAEYALEQVLEWLDDEHSDPDGDNTEPNAAMIAAAMEFAKVIKAEYTSWNCEPTGEVIEYTREQAEEGKQ